MEPIKVVFFTHEVINSPLKHLRVVGPISFTNMEFKAVTDTKEDIYNYIDDANIIVIQRTFPADVPLFTRIYEASRKLKKPLVYDLDDNLLILPKTHPDRENYSISRGLLPMLHAAFAADYLTVSSECLKQNFSNVNPNIFILPNLIDDKIWKFKSPTIEDHDSKLTIGYMGGDSHTSDLDYIAPVLTKIKEQHPNKVRYHIYGVKPPEALLAFNDTAWTPIKTYQYEDFAKEFQKISFDIFIAPLLDNEFNRCKSPIKFLEYTTLGVPVICSQVSPYSEVITDGENGLLANDPDQWDEKINLLVLDPELRYRLAVNAQTLAEDKYLMSKNSDQWLNTYRKINEHGISSPNQKDLSENFIQSISDQLCEYHAHIDAELAEQRINIDRKNKTLARHKEEIHDLKIRIQNMENKIKDLQGGINCLQSEYQTLQTEYQNLQRNLEACEQQLLQYALSKSWRYTRPFRKLKRRILGDKND